MSNVVCGTSVKSSHNHESEVSKLRRNVRHAESSFYKPTWESRWGSRPGCDHTSGLRSSHHVSLFRLSWLNVGSVETWWKRQDSVYLRPGVVRAAAGGTDLVLWARVSLGVDLSAGWMSSVWSRLTHTHTHNLAAIINCRLVQTSVLRRPSLPPGFCSEGLREVKFFSDRFLKLCVINRRSWKSLVRDRNDIHKESVTDSRLT